MFDEDDGSMHIVSSDMVMTQIEDCAELATVKVYYRDLIKFADGKIPIISESKFTMLYGATISAGIDFSEVEAAVDTEANTITITIPSATVLSVDVDEDSIEYYDKSSSLFNPNDLEAATEALAQADEDARGDVEELGLLDEATNQAIAVIESFVSSFSEEAYADEDGKCYTIEVVVDDGEEE